MTEACLNVQLKDGMDFRMASSLEIKEDSVDGAASWNSDGEYTGEDVESRKKRLADAGHVFTIDGALVGEPGTDAYNTEREKLEQ